MACIQHLSIKWIGDPLFFLQYCSHQYWMGSNGILSSHLTVLLLSLNHGNIKRREKISEIILEWPGIEPGAAGREASMLSTVLCAPPPKINSSFDQVKEG